MNKFLHLCNQLPEYLYHLKIRSKLLMFLVIPLSAMSLIGGSQTYAHYQTLLHAKQSRLSVNISLQLDVLIHQLQKERGLTAGYIGGRGRQYKNKLNKQRKQTDIQITLFNQLSDRIKNINWQLPSLSDKKTINDNLSLINIEFTKLKAIRESVDQLTYCDCFKFYSKINARLLELIQQNQVTSEDTDQIRNSNNFIRLLWLEERAGQERGALNGILTSGKIELSQLQQVLTYAANQDQLIQSFFATAKSHHKQWLATQLNSTLNQQVEEFRARYKKKIARVNIINDIQYLIGYGGLIHNFKNYILRGEQYYVEQFDANVETVISKINDYMDQAEPENQDFVAIETIEQTIDKYQKGMLLAIKLHKTDATVEAIDKLVKIDDSEVIAAIYDLKRDTSFIDNNIWWRLSTKRIERFQQISDHISEDMADLATTTEQQAIRNLILNLLLLLFTLLASVYLAYLLLKRLVDEIEAIASAIRCMNNEQDFNKPLKVHGCDEISQMATAFNNMLNQRQQFEGESIISAAVFEHASEAIMITNADNKIETVNPAFSAISGYSKEEVVGKPPAILQSGRHDAKFYQQMWQHLLNNDSWQGEIWNRRKNGEIYPEFLAISVVKDKNNQIIQYISLFSDITKHKKYEQDIWHQANFDALTGLPNRSLCLDRLGHEIQMAKRTSDLLALMFIDLDRFKYVNDTLGHNCGDELLQIAAKRLIDCLRKTDTVARFGGDEFVIILPAIANQYDIERLAESIIVSLSTPFILANQHEAIVSASIGITRYPNDADNAVELLKNADTAMYQAKDSGRNTFRFFTNAMNQMVMGHMKLELELRKAVERREFCLHYQPVVSLKSGKVVGAEALIRWQHPKKGLIYPDNFITLAEETGLIEQIGEWVLQQAITDLKQWHDLGHKLHVAVNISGRQCNPNCQKPINDIIAKALQTNELEPCYLKVEITESLLMDDSQKTIETLQAIRNLGVAIHMDDFGTGYSSLSYLKRFPIDVLKIDRSFISGAIEDQTDASLVEAVVIIGHSLHLKLVAEGIETQQHFDYLKQLGCDYGQGYHMSKPLEAARFIDFIEQTQKQDAFLLT